MSNEPVTPVIDRETAARVAETLSASAAVPELAPGVVQRALTHQPLLPGRRSRLATLLKSGISLVCPGCELINHIAAGAQDQNATCEHCGAGLFQGRVLDFNAANFDLHVHATRLPTAVVFWAPWCKPCEAVLALAERAVRQLEPMIRIGRVNTDEERELVSRFNVRGIPTLLLFRRGREALRRIGYVDLQSISRWARA